MAAGLGFKTFATGEVLSAANVNGYLMQGILVFATEAARNAAITVPAEGQFAFTKDNNTTWFYDGAAWVVSGGGGVTALAAEVVRTSTQTITGGATTAISWSSAPTNVSSIWAAGNSTRLTVPTGKGGVWFVSSALTTNNASGQIKTAIYKNGSAITNIQNTFALSSTNISGANMSAILTLAAADYIEIFCSPTNNTEIVSTQSSASFTFIGA